MGAAYKICSCLYNNSSKYLYDIVHISLNNNRNKYKSTVVDYLARFGLNNTKSVKMAS